MSGKDRIQVLNKGEMSGKYVLLWIQQSQRAHFNHALEYAVHQANSKGLPVLAVFGVTENFPGANMRHYSFMLEGLMELEAALKERGIPLVVRLGSPDEVVLSFEDEAAMIVCERGYLRIQREWRRNVGDRAVCPVVQVESDVVVPVESASGKEEYGAYTIRPKINKLLDYFMEKPPVIDLKNPFDGNDFDSEHLDGLLDTLELDRSVEPVAGCKGGYSHAKERLDYFIENVLHQYDEERNDPNSGAVSGLSPYLHFGQISPLEIALEAKGKEGSPAFLEELIVRRELAVNMAFYNPDYDSLNALPGWAQDTLKAHEGDMREYLYTLEQLENCDTHDPAWNAAQLEMKRTGKMHGYMRMYWGKKIIEWSESAEEAYKAAIYLNDKYHLDGRDPNGFTGVLWCFGKHDRPWKEREIFGKVRYMNYNGLKRKFDVDAYIRSQG
ncbi:deoxyribodipyrimidine photo-lyase [Limisalsivibrio acetivorans]|uniref:deoxyribodipyrimidine photo-lyase n=1 Tax=Limisalsivibrio acetivorans TaxID=1304888 RepID=UPI0003B781B5|nr:deoxyribodipyrimidine photo-lyase [Limisalsivibrio acetivorans]